MLRPMVNRLSTVSGLAESGGVLSDSETPTSRFSEQALIDLQTGKIDSTALRATQFQPPMEMWSATQGWYVV